MFDELIGVDLGAVRFAEALHQRIAERWADFEVSYVGDPAGDAHARRLMSERCLTS